MATAERLLQQASEIQALDPSNPLEVALVAEQRQRLREEVLRIDEKYQSGNLLRLIPIAAKAFEGLKEKYKEE